MAFGVVTKGMDVVSAIEACGTRSGSPTAVVRIVESGVLESDRMIEEEEGEEGLSVAEEEMLKKRGEKGMDGEKEDYDDENENENVNKNENELSESNIESNNESNESNIELNENESNESNHHTEHEIDQDTEIDRDALNDVESEQKQNRRDRLDLVDSTENEEDNDDDSDDDNNDDDEENEAKEGGLRRKSHLRQESNRFLCVS